MFTNTQTPITEMFPWRSIRAIVCRSGLSPVQMHFRNHCLEFPGKFLFFEVSCFIFKDAIAYVERNVIFEMVYRACVQVNSGDIFVYQLGLVREPVWAWKRQCCPSFTDMSANAVFSDIFQVNTFGELTFDFKSLFFIQIPIIPFVHSVTSKSPSLQMWLSCILPINIYIRMVLKILFQKLCCQISINFSVFIAKIILEVLLYYDILFLCQHS